MKNNRHILNSEEKVIIGFAKDALTATVGSLKQRGVREANIEIELMTHIKKILKGE